MSGWDAYAVNVVQNAKGNCEKACLLGRDSGDPWCDANACSDVISLNPGERQHIAQLVKKPETAPMSGVTLASEKYMYIRTTDNAMIFKKGNKGCVIKPTNQTIIVGVSKPEGLMPDVLESITKISEHLSQQSY